MTASTIISEIDAFVAAQNKNRGGSVAGGGTVPLDYDALTGYALILIVSADPRDQTEAVRLFATAAEQENGSAEYWLGRLSLEGRGVPQSDREAVRWLQRSADHNSEVGQTLLGDLYLEGRGVPKDQAMAEKLYRQAAADPTYKEARRSLEASEKLSE